MTRLCERPGCSDPASVAYGMRATDLVFWLDQLRDPAANDSGVLCLRHADSMVVPRNWTLDDLRDPDLHLFRPPADSQERRRGSRRSHAADDTEQLELEVPDDDTADVARAPAAIDGDDGAWSPSFDVADDLDGLLSARSPLLARAFRGDDLPRS